VFECVNTYRFYWTANFVVVFVVVDVLVPPIITKECPFPHWPPVIPPIVAILLSLLMIPCYCYSCGPLSGPYWADERRKQERQQLIEQSYYNRPVTESGYNAGPIRRPMPYSYGRLWVNVATGDETIWWHCYAKWYRLKPGLYRISAPTNPDSRIRSFFGNLGKSSFGQIFSRICRMPVQLHCVQLIYR